MFPGEFLILQIERGYVCVLVDGGFFESGFFEKERWKILCRVIGRFVFACSFGISLGDGIYKRFLCSFSQLGDLGQILFKKRK